MSHDPHFDAAHDRWLETTERETDIPSEMPCMADGCRHPYKDHNPETGQCLRNGCIMRHDAADEIYHEFQHPSDRQLKEWAEAEMEG